MRKTTAICDVCTIKEATYYVTIRHVDGDAIFLEKDTCLDCLVDFNVTKPKEIPKLTVVELAVEPSPSVEKKKIQSLSELDSQLENDKFNLDEFKLDKSKIFANIEKAAKEQRRNSSVDPNEEILKRFGA